MSNNKEQSEYENFIPFGPEWEKEMMKLPKKVIIDMFRTKCIEVQNLKNEQEKESSNLN